MRAVRAGGGTKRRPSASSTSSPKPRSASSGPGATRPPVRPGVSRRPRTTNSISAAKSRTSGSQNGIHARRSSLKSQATTNTSAAARAADWSVSRSGSCHIRDSVRAALGGGSWRGRGQWPAEAPHRARLLLQPGPGSACTFGSVFEPGPRGAHRSSRVARVPATLMDGRALAAADPRRGDTRDRGARSRRAGDRARRRRPRVGRLHPAEAQGRDGSRDRRPGHPPRREYVRGGGARARRGAQRRRPGGRDPRPAAAPRAHGRDARHLRRLAAEGRRRLPPRERRAPVSRHAAPRARDPGGLYGASRRVRHRARRAGTRS